jgi:hypothetical protein
MPQPNAEAFTNDVGRLFNSLQKEYCRCRGKVYIDVPDGKAEAVGWVFEKEMGYEDKPSEKYIREVWVTLYDEPDTVQVTKHYHYI